MILTGKKLNAFPVNSRIKQDFFLFNIELEVLVTAIRQEKKKESELERKRENLLFAYDMILCK